MTHELARTLILLGIFLAFIGIILYFSGQIGLGRLPGDFIIRGRNYTFYFPLATSLLISLLASIIVYLFRR